MLTKGPDPARPVARIAYEDLTPGRKFDLGTVEIDREEMVEFARRFDPHVFYSVDDLHSAAAGVAPLSRRRLGGLVPSFFRLQRAD